MTTAELLNRGERADIATMWGRATRLIVPLLAAMAALATFVSFRNRDRVTVAVIEASAAALVPDTLLYVAGIAADTSSGPPVIAVGIGCVVAAVPALWMWLRWRKLRKPSGIRRSRARSVPCCWLAQAAICPASRSACRPSYRSWRL